MSFSVSLSRDYDGASITRIWLFREMARAITSHYLATREKLFLMEYAIKSRPLSFFFIAFPQPASFNVFQIISSFMFSTTDDKFSHIDLLNVITFCGTYVITFDHPL